MGSGEPAQVAYVNGRIYTVDTENRVADAVLIVGDSIRAVGSRAQIDLLLTPTTRVIDLRGGVVLPGFVDAHSHFPVAGLPQISIDLSPPPVGEIASLEELLMRIKAAADKQPAGEWLLGFNYDNAALADGRHPTRLQLDAVSGDHPVYLWHLSGHMGVANSHALNRLQIHEHSEPPPGGRFGRNALTGNLNGLLQEKAAPDLASLLIKIPKSRLLQVLTAARDSYLAAGVTTVQNGSSSDTIEAVLRWSQRLGLLAQRVLLWPAPEKPVGSSLPATCQAHNNDWFYRGAIKLVVDGSPQGLTAYLTEPYFDKAGKAADYRGFPAFSDQQLNALVLQYHQAGCQLALHGNGDAAIDSIIKAVEAAQHEVFRPDARHVLVHAQMLRYDQLLRMRNISLTPSFFIGHIYYWGDWHRLNALGPARAENISPAQWADDVGVRYSLHTDAPVTPMLPMQMLWSATQRQTLQRHVLGPAQQISMQRAVRAITIDAAWQNHLEHSRGSIEVGKLADMVLLSGDPFDEADVRDIQVLATLIGGVERYRRKGVLREQYTARAIR